MLEVDQSGKIGDTKQATVLACANDIQRAILIPASVKRECVHRLRNKGMAGGTLYLHLFVRGLFFLLSDILARGEMVMIDEEYPGHEREIKQQLLNLCKRNRLEIDPTLIRFGRIGKKSNVHILALATLQGHRKPTRLLDVDELLGI